MWRFGDSFDHYGSSDFGAKYDMVSGATIGVGLGRYGTNSAHIASGRLGKGLTTGGGSTAGAFAQFALFSQSTLAMVNAFAELWDAVAGYGHVVLYRNADSSISAKRAVMGQGPLLDGTLLGTSRTGVLPLGRYVHLQIFVQLHATAGTVRVRVDGAEVLTVTGVQTANTSGTWSTWIIGSDSHNTNDFDDFICYDDVAGDGVTDFLGDLTGECLIASGVGATSQWTPSSGTNVSCVDDVTPDGDTSYVEDAIVGHVDTYTVPPLTRIVDGIRCVQVAVTAKKGGTGTRAIAPVIRRATTNYLGANQTLGTGYGVALAAFPSDPSGGSWTAGGVGASQIGQQVTV